MNILITQGKSSLAAALVSRLSASHTVRLTDVDGSAGDAAITQCDLGHDGATDDLVSGIDAIIHIGYNAVDSGDPSELIDYHTRCTYNLLTAASGTGVARCIYLSTLRLLETTRRTSPSPKNGAPCLPLKTRYCWPAISAKLCAKSSHVTA